MKCPDCEGQIFVDDMGMRGTCYTCNHVFRVLVKRKCSECSFILSIDKNGELGFCDMCKMPRKLDPPMIRERIQ